ncbi:MFS transporter [Telluria mixta]|uniref:MFS transporter n=1 Tax=Telluria mixta TaxID=34071 RepID=A0ABT2BTT8_9BURK|nr:MFS transporter [Telluria mixta]MCS0628542.1 MFS transporter [Telluria mixta]WEM93353.1 MFS transporter [Telluria mixta]
MSDADYAPRQWDPDERPTLPGGPSFPKHSTPRRIAYFLIGTLVTITGGLGNALVTVNLVNLQGTLGVFAAEVNWLPTAYVMTNVSMNLLLVKFRQQFGLRAFTEFFLVLYALITFAHLFVNDLGSAIAVRAAHGMAGAALSTLGLYYSLQAFKREWRPRGIVISTGIAQLAQPIAYIFSRSLLQIAEWRGLYLFELGLTLVTLAAVLWLKLPPGDRFKAFRPTDFLTFSLFAPGMALLCAALTFGRVLWWTENAWVGVALAASVVLLLAAICVEHNRDNPLLNIRWLTNGMILRLSIALMLVRVVLSEQSVGAVGFLRLVGLNNDEMQTLFIVILLATVLGIVVSVLVTRPPHLMAPQVVALLIMALGAWIDSNATNATRPAQMYVSQGLLAFGGVMFLGPLLLTLLGSVIANPANLISFSVLFGLTQNLGGLIGSSLLGTFQVMREKYHSSVLAEQLSSLDPLVAARIQQYGAAYARQLADPSARTRQGISVLTQTAAREANILAYNDVFLLIAIIATLLAAWIFGRSLWLKYVAPPPPAPVPVPAPPDPTDSPIAVPSGDRRTAPRPPEPAPAVPT